MNAKTSESFDAFWAAYPRKVGKGKARRVWARLRPAQPLLSEIMDAIDWQKKSVQWTKDGGQFIPHPATWLNQERWSDEPMLVQETRIHIGRGAEACDAFDRAGEALERLYERRSGQAQAEKRLEAPSRPPTSKA